MFSRLRLFSIRRGNNGLGLRVLSTGFAYSIFYSYNYFNIY